MQRLRGPQLEPRPVREIGATEMAVSTELHQLQEQNYGEDTPRQSASLLHIVDSIRSPTCFSESSDSIPFYCLIHHSGASAPWRP